MDNTIQEEKKDCPKCVESAKMLAIGVAHSACNVVEDEQKRTECDTWAKSIDPKEVTDATEVWVGLLKQVGIKGANERVQVFNQGYQSAIIKIVTEMKANGETIPQDFMTAYEEVLKKWRP
jgi:hypothetical protein